MVASCLMMSWYLMAVSQNPVHVAHRILGFHAVVGVDVIVDAALQEQGDVEGPRDVSPKPRDPKVFHSNFLEEFVPRAFGQLVALLVKGATTLST